MSGVSKRWAGKRGEAATAAPPHKVGSHRLSPFSPSAPKRPSAVKPAEDCEHMGWLETGEFRFRIRIECGHAAITSDATDCRHGCEAKVNA